MSCVHVRVIVCVGGGGGLAAVAVAACCCARNMCYSTTTYRLFERVLQHTQISFV